MMFLPMRFPQNKDYKGVMLRLERIVLSDYLLFKNLDWRIDTANLWVVRGENRDAKSYSGHSGNGVGKSLIFNGLATLWLAQPPFSNRKNSAKDILTDKSSFTLYGKGTKSFAITQSVNKSVQYDINVNGEAKKVRKSDDARKLIADLLPLTSEHFYSMVYINSFRPSILQTGTPAKRYDFMEEIFNLSIYDQINKALLKMFAEMRYQKQELEEKQNENKELKKIDVSSLQVRCKKLQTELSVNMEKLQEQQQQLEKLDRIVPLFNKLSTDFSLAKLEKLVQKYAGIVEKLEAKLEKHYNSLADIKEYEKSVDHNSQIKKEKSKLEHRLSKLYPRSVWEHIENHYNEVQEILRGKLVIQKIRQENIEDLKRYWYYDFSHYEQKALDIAGKLEFSVKSKEINQEIAANEQILSKLERLTKETVCPTCLQELSKAELQSLLSNTESKIAELTEQAKVFTALAWKNRIEKKFDASVLGTKDTDTLLCEIDRLKNLVDRQVDFLALYSRYNSLKLVKVNKPNFVKLDTKSLKKELSEARKKHSTYSQELEMVRLIGRNYSQEEKTRLTKKHKFLKSSVQKLYKLVSPMQEKVQSLVSTLAKAEMTQEQKEKLEKQISELEQNTQDHDVLRVLLDIYSPKGVRVDHIRALLDSYIALLNQYAPTIFSEKIKFSSKVKGTQFSIFSTRGSRTSDVNSLSGAESRQFLALSAFVLRMLMPESQRCNIMVLDEIEAGMSEVNRNLFCKEFIPLLLQDIPTVIVVTPYTNQGLFLPKAKELKLIRKGNTTHAEIN